MKSVAMKAFAKINLGLSVIGRREDGYHELRTIYQTISLADQLEVSLGGGGTGVDLETRGIDVPTGRDNLAVRAAMALLRELGVRRKVAISLRKRIPAGGGMGGASSDAATVLRVLLLLTGKKLPFARLLHLAAELGSDVPFFLMGGRALGVGRGEEVYQLADLPRRSCVLLLPRDGVNTTDAFRRLKAPVLTASHSRPNIESFCGAVHEGSYPNNRTVIGNDFEALVLEQFPQLAKARKQLRRASAETVMLSGSGSALYALFEDREKARNAAAEFQKSDLRVLLARTVSSREFQAAVSAASVSG